MRPIWRRRYRDATAPAAADPEGDLAPEEFHTPGRKTIAEVAEFTGLPETSQMKSLVLVADGKPVLVLLRGDHQLSETKFGAVVERSGIPPGASATRSANGSAPMPARSGRWASRTCRSWRTRRWQAAAT